MQENKKLSKCTNCQKQLQQYKLDLHYSYCIRNIKKCPICQHFYDIHLEQQHQHEYHNKQLCNRCSKQLLTSQLPSHNIICKQNIMICQYCHLNVPFDVFQQHLIACQSRTSTCQICHSNVQNKFYQAHYNQCIINICSQNQEKYQRQQQILFYNRREGQQSVAKEVFKKKRNVTDKKLKKQDKILSNGQQQQQVKSEVFKKKRITKEKKQKKQDKTQSNGQLQQQGTGEVFNKKNRKNEKLKQNKQIQQVICVDDNQIDNQCQQIDNNQNNTKL